MWKGGGGSDPLTLRRSLPPPPFHITTRAYAIKIVNPGGVAMWKGGGGSDRRNVSGLDDTLGSSVVTPRKILETLAGAANALALPHPVHIHCNNLRSEEHTSELQSLAYLVCRLLLEKKKKKQA